MNKDLLRIIDANLNRCREGLRVCEEIARFILEDRRLTAEFKKLRQDISRTIKKFPAISKKLLRSRNSSSDVGKAIAHNLKRKNYQDVFFANIQRVKESLRVLEEFSKISNQSLARVFARIRFAVYTLEKRVAQKRKKLL